MQRLSLLFPFCILVVGCVATPIPKPLSLPPQLPSASATFMTTTQPTRTPEPTATAEPPKQYDFLLLGSDYSARRAELGYRTEGNQRTDVSLLVSILMTEPMQVTVIQIPRNLYVKIDQLPDYFAYQVYASEGWAGLHYWWQEVFDADLDAIFMVNFDQFRAIMDDIGPVPVSGNMMDADTLLLYLRNNENNWEKGHYDFEGRQFITLKALWEWTRDGLGSDPVRTATAFLKEWGGLIQTDISAVGQWWELFTIAYAARMNDPDIEFVQLKAPDIERGPVPMQPGRGEVPTVDLKVWFAMVTADR